jgi:hypothetical protein
MMNVGVARAALRRWVGLAYKCGGVSVALPLGAVVTSAKAFSDAFCAIPRSSASLLFSFSFNIATNIHLHVYFAAHLPLYNHFTSFLKLKISCTYRILT